MYGEETAERQYLECYDNLFTQRESEYDFDTEVGAVDKQKEEISGERR